MSQKSHPYRTNRDLFSNHYLNEHLRQTEPWEEVDQDEIRDTYEEIRELWEDKKHRVEDYNESSLEDNFIRPMFDILGIPFEVEQTVKRNARRPDYGFFPSSDAGDAAYDRDDFYEEAIAVADAKRWGRKLDTRGEEKRDFENPSYQIHRYLQETPPQWAVLTNGEKWRLYYGPTSHRLDSFYEIDLPELLDIMDEENDFEAFKEFYLFFRQEAFLPDKTGDCFLDNIYDESNTFAEALGEDLQENIYEAIRVLAEGFLDTNDDLNEETLVEDLELLDKSSDFEQARLDLIHDSSLIYLYRLIFVLYAESEGRNLLPTDNEIYSGSYSLNELKLEVVENRDATQQHYQTWQTELWDQLDELFVLIDQGSQGQGIPKKDLYIPAYNGGLFRTSPDRDDSVESQFLSNYEAGDAYLAEVIELLTRHEADRGKGKVFVDYSSLDERNLGSIYEGLLEYKLDVADEPLTVDDGEYTPADEDDNVTVEEGDVYLRTDDGERKATGSYYTPEHVVEYIVDETLGPLVDEIREDMLAESAYGDERGFAEEFADRVFELTVLDPAMGSGHFPVNAVDYLAREIIDAQEQQDRQALDSADAEVRAPTTEDGELRDINWARRKVAQRCIYGVDVNPLATELAKVSLWLRTLAAEQPLAFLDHHLKTGNSLVGSDIEDVLSDGNDDATEEGQLTLQQSFDHTRQRAMEHVTDRFQDLLNIDNETLEDAKEMEAVYDEVRDDPMYQKLLAMANVHTADAFGLDVPDDADERMARALHSGVWEKIEEQDWFKSAQAMAEEERFFHWELEFPMAFYNQGGERKADAGFDAVIGNPPYINIMRIPDKQVDYLKEKWNTAFRRFDLYVLFSELAYNVGTNGARHGYIVPDKLFTESYGTEWRKATLKNHGLTRILDLRDQNVFDDATNSPIVFIMECGRPRDSITIEEWSGDAALKRASLPVSGFIQTPGSQIRIDWTENTEALLSEIRSGTFQLSRVAYASWGAQPGNASRFVFDERPEDKENVKRLIKGSDLQRYSVQYCDRYLWYDQDELHRPAFPELFENEKLCFRKVAGKNGLIGAFDDQEYYTEDSVINVIRKADLVKADEDVLGARGIEIVDESRPSAEQSEGKTYDRDTVIYSDDLNLSQKISLRAILGIVNSNLIHYYYAQAISGQLNVFPEHVRSLPIQHNDRAYDKISEKVSKITNYSQRKQGLNLSLLDYLGSYKEGPSLPDIGLFQPTEPNLLDATTEDYEKLQIERARTSRDGQTVKIEVTARYKPKDEDEFETDTWGYTETDFYEAFTLTNLNQEEAALVEAFVPVAVDEELGGFRDNATKSNSLVDRLKGLNLPDPDDVADDLRRYTETKERADELDEKIEKTDRLIDEIVYDLYDLTDEEIEIVEEAVADD
jgi:type I restriction-modification system DNA methylase subunit